MTAQTALIGALALVLGLPIILLARRAAQRIGLVDRPDARKRHVGEVPLAGGIGVYLTVAAVTVALAFVGTVPLLPQSLATAVLVLAVPALALGIADDFKDLSARLRLLFQIGIALALVLVFDIRIVGLGDVLGTGGVGFKTAGSVLFTVFCVVGVLNATNMMDGVDGLLAAVASVTFVAVGALALSSHAPTVPALCVSFVGALGAFLAFNLSLLGRKRRLFLGDSGSMMLGLALAGVLIQYTQLPGSPIKPVVAGWLLGLPLLDSSVVMARRLKERRSPFSAGRDHLHHRLLNLGLSPARTLVVMLALQVLLVAVGLVAQFSAIPAYVFFYAFVFLVVAGFLTDVGLDPEQEAERVGSSTETRTPATVPDTAGVADELSLASRSAAAGSPSLAAPEQHDSAENERQAPPEEGAPPAPVRPKEVTVDA